MVIQKMNENFHKTVKLNKKNFGNFHRKKTKSLLNLKRKNIIEMRKLMAFL